MTRSRAWWGMLIPRPHSFLMNSVLFALGLLFAWLEGYRGEVGSSESGHPVWFFVVVWFFAQEFLVGQAKYTWNDIRDHDRDQQIPANRVRPIASQPLSSTIVIIMVVRYSFGMVLAGLLSPVLLTVVLMISGLQFVYELLAKPGSKKRPALPMFIVASGFVLKTCAGALALGVPAGEQRMWFFGLALFATGVVFISSFWRVEADYFKDRGLTLPRGQNAYFFGKGMAWLMGGTAVTIAACTVLFFDGYNQFLNQYEMGTALVLGGIFILGIICCCAGFVLAQASRAIRIAAAASFIAGSMAFGALRIETLIPIPREALSASLLAILLLLDHRLNVRMDYQQHNLIHLRKNWPVFKRSLSERPSKPRGLRHWQQIFRLGLALNKPQSQLNQNGDLTAQSHSNGVNQITRTPEARGEGQMN